MNLSTYCNSEQDSQLEILLKLYVWLEQTVNQNKQQTWTQFNEDSNQELLESKSTDESLYLVHKGGVNNSEPVVHSHDTPYNVNNTFRPIPENESEISADSNNKKRKHEDNYPTFVCHTLESMKEEEERKKNQPKRPRGRPRKHSFEQKKNDTKRVKIE